VYERTLGVGGRLDGCTSFVAKLCEAGRVTYFATMVPGFG
jgi:hypothetical protein